MKSEKEIREAMRIINRTNCKTSCAECPIGKICNSNTSTLDVLRWVLRVGR
jgi:hypothetical protein